MNGHFQRANQKIILRIDAEKSAGFDSAIKNTFLGQMTSYEGSG